MMRFWLERDGRTLPLDEGNLLLGRGADAHIVLDDRLASRRHARLTVSPFQLSVRDLGSVNGVFVNGQRIKQPRALKAGDLLLIGRQEFRVGAAARSQQPKVQTQRFAADTLAGLKTLDDSEATHTTGPADSLALIGGVVDKVLALGRGGEAERLIGLTLRKILDSAERSGEVDDELAELAAQYAVRLAAATRKGEWVNFCFRLYSVRKRPLPAELVDQLFTELRRVDGVDLTTLRKYRAVLSKVASDFGPADRFLLQRILGLERLLAAG